MKIVLNAIAAFACLFVAVSAAADVRPISEAERAAVQVVANYLADGPQAVVDRLSADSPLHRIPKQLVATEVEARLGPAKGANWRLATVVDGLKDKCAAFTVSYPSGIDDTVFIEMAKAGAEYRVSDIRITAMPTRRVPLFAAAAVAAPSSGDAFDIDTAAGLGGLVAVVISLVAVFAAASRPGLARALYLLALIAGAGTLAMAALRGQRLRVSPSAPQAAAPHELSLAPLIGVRSALAAGGADVGSPLAATHADGENADIMRLWKAQWDFQQMRLEDVRRALDTFPTPSNIPLAELLRARMALIENNPVRASEAYQRAINAGPGRDALWIEASEAMMQGGFTDRALPHLTRLIDLGTREPSVYYARAAASRFSSELERELEHAWNLCPVERADLVASDMLFSLVRKKGNSFIDLSRPQEASFASPALATRSIALPATCTARVSGDYLHLKLPDAELAVPGGAALAPAGTQVVSADEWSRLQQADALADVPALVASAPSAASYMQPALRQRMARSTTALAERNRWADVATLTNGISPKAEFVPMELFFLRARALQRMDRDAEAKQLLLDVAASPVVERRRNALDFEELGDMLASYDQYDRAGQMFDKARKLRPSGYDEVRLVQLGMDKRLANEYSTQATEHFDIRYPSELPSGFAGELAIVLEGELKRLQAFVPVANFKRVTVNVVWWQDFTSIYTGSEDILGFYNGKITIPLAGILEYEPEVVALVTHELAHAMIAQATNSQAPHWFQEGLAQRLEMTEYAPNPFNMYDDTKLLAVPVLEPVLTTSRDGDMVGAAYIVSQTLIRFIEQRYGADALQKFMAQYAANATTDEAIRAVTGATTADFDAAFRAWGRAEKRVFQSTIAVRYDQHQTTDMSVPTAHAAPRPRGNMGAGTFYPQPGRNQ